MRVWLLSALLLVGCQAGPQPATSPTPTEPQGKLGNQLYGAHCAHCHEVESGEGPQLKAKVLATHGNAARLWRYNKKFMPYGKDYRLTDEEYWAITAYLLQRTEMIGPEDELSPETAEQISLKGKKEKR